MLLRPKADDIFRPIGSLQGEHSRLFAGRGGVIDSILESLELSGTVPVIFGERGIGKSSVAWRVFDILRQKDVNQEYGDVASRFALDDNYIALWVECGDWFAEIESAVLAILMPKGLRQAVTMLDLFPDFLSTEDKAKATASFELNLAIFKAKTSLSTEEGRDLVTKAFRNATQTALADPIEMFSQVCGRLQDRFSNSTIIIFIDEFDRLPDTTLVGSVLKTFTGTWFVITGVADTAEKLIGSHPSVGRKIFSIRIPPFDHTEASEIFEKASDIAKSYQGSHGISFSQKLIDQIFDDTGGYPNLIQKVGFNTIQPDRLHAKMFDEHIKIGIKNYKPALRAMFKASNKKGGAEDEVENRLMEVIGDSNRRSAILKVFVGFGTKWVGLGELISRLDQDDQKQLNRNLKMFVEGGIIERGCDEEYRFINPIYLMASRLYLESKI